MQGGWGKRAWKQMQGGWGKREYPWQDKRTWQKFQVRIISHSDLKMCNFYKKSSVTT